MTANHELEFFQTNNFPRITNKSSIKVHAVEVFFA